MSRLDLSGDAASHPWAIALMYGALVGGVMALTVIGGSLTFTAALAITVVATGLGTGAHVMFSRGFGGWAGAGTTSVARKAPFLGKAKVAIARGNWDEARAELDEQWAVHPGHGDVVREYERFFLTGLKAPAAGAEWLRGALERVQGADRSYVYLRLAELCAGADLARPDESRLWCRRVIGEFPQSAEAGHARPLLASLEAAPAAGGSPA